MDVYIPARQPQCKCEFIRYMIDNRLITKTGMFYFYC